jgi:hypothetical protein
MPITIKYASSTKVQPKLWRITSPSLRTNLLVETPTLAVCGAIGLPISAPTEFKVGSSSGHLAPHTLQHFFPARPIGQVCSG